MCQIFFCNVEKFQNYSINIPYECFGEKPLTHFHLVYFCQTLAQEVLVHIFGRPHVPAVYLVELDLALDLKHICFKHSQKTHKY